MPFTLEELLSDDQRLRSVQLHEPILTVISIMHQHDYDQLPVVDSDGETSLDQVVTHAGILQAIQSFGTKIESLQVRDVARSVRTYAPDADLLVTLDDIQRDNFALIVDEENRLTGIVTTADTTVFFREYAQDLMQIEGIESRLKDSIRALYHAREDDLRVAIEAVTDRAADIRRKLPAAIKTYLAKTGQSIPAAGSDNEALLAAEEKLGLPEAGKKFEDLSFDEFIQVLLRHSNAPKLTQANDTRELRSLLERVRNARNKLAHFRGELTSEERRTIQFAAEWLERNLPILPDEVPSSTPVAPPVIPVTEEAPTNPPAPEEEDSVPHGSYAPLAAHLNSLHEANLSTTLSFAAIEKILGKALPKSAFTYRAWWSNDPSHPQSMAWLNEGWRTTGLSMTERRLTFIRTSDREATYINFFARLNSRLEHELNAPLRKMSPQGQSWIILAPVDPQKPEAVNINASFTQRKEFRIDLYIDYGDKEVNKRKYDELYTKKAQIESAVGEPLHWERLDNKRACRIAAYTKAQILTDADSPLLMEWAVRKVCDFHRAFTPEFPAKG